MQELTARIKSPSESDARCNLRLCFFIVICGLLITLIIRVGHGIRIQFACASFNLCLSGHAIKFGIFSVKKHDRILSMVENLTRRSGRELPVFYTAYFEKFNAQEFYEAHDVLEHLWLADRSAASAQFYKGLIQLAGAFVHMQKQFLRPSHPKDGRRLRPAARLFLLAQENITPFGSSFMFLDLRRVHELISTHVHFLQGHDFSINPWSPDSSPTLSLNI